MLHKAKKPKKTHKVIQKQKVFITLTFSTFFREDNEKFLTDDIDCNGNPADVIKSLNSLYCAVLHIIRHGPCRQFAGKN